MRSRDDDFREDFRRSGDIECFLGDSVIRFLDLVFGIGSFFGIFPVELGEHGILLFFSAFANPPVDDLRDTFRSLLLTVFLGDFGIPGGSTLEFLRLGCLEGVSGSPWSLASRTILRGPFQSEVVPHMTSFSMERVLEPKGEGDMVLTANFVRPPGDFKFPGDTLGNCNIMAELGSESDRFLPLRAVAESLPLLWGGFARLAGDLGDWGMLGLLQRASVGLFRPSGDIGFRLDGFFFPRIECDRIIPP